MKGPQENDNGRQFHITLNRYDRDVLEAMKARHGTSLSGAIRACIRAAGLQLGMAGDDIHNV
jgi:hypothetical protein